MCEFRERKCIGGFLVVSDKNGRVWLVLWGWGWGCSIVFRESVKSNFVFS